MDVVHRCAVILGLSVALSCEADVRLIDDLGHVERISAIARADRAGLVYSASRAGRIKAHRLADGAVVADFQLQSDRALTALAVHPGKPTILALATSNSRSEDARILIFDASRAERIRELEGNAHVLQYSPDARYLVGNLFGEINVWLPDEGELYVSLRCDDGSWVQFIDERTLAYVSGKKLRRLDLDSGQILREDSLPFGKRFILLPRAQDVLLVDSSNVLLWDLQRAVAKSQHRLLTTPDVLALDSLTGNAFLGQTNTVALGDVRHPMYRLWGAGLASIHGLQGADEVPTALNAHDGVLIVGQANGRLRRWQFRGEQIDTLSDLGLHLPAVRVMATSAADRYLAIADLEGPVDVLDTATGIQRTFDPHEARIRPPPPHFGSQGRLGLKQSFTVGQRKRRPRVSDIAFFPASSHFAVSYDDGDLRVVDAATLAEQPAESEHVARGARFAPLDSERMLMSAESGVHVWNRAQARRERTIPLSFASTWLQADPQNDLLLVGSLDRAEVRSLSGELVHSLADFGGCAVLLKKRLIYTDTASRSLAVWNLASRSFETPLPGPTELLSRENCGVAHSRAYFVQWDGNAWIVEAAADGRLRSIRYDTRARVSSVAPANSSNALLLGGPQRSLVTVEMTTGRRLGRLTIFDNEEWLAVDARNRFDGPPQMWSRLRFADTMRPFTLLDPGLGFEALYSPETLRVVIGLAAPAGSSASTMPAAPVSAAQPPEVSILQPRATYRIRYGLAQQSTWSDNRNPPQLSMTAMQVGEEYGLVEADPKLPDAPIEVRAQAIDRGGGIASCRLLRNRQVVHTFSSPAVEQGRALITARVEPLAGENQLSFECFDSQEIRSDPARVDVVVESSSVATGTAYIVAIGIDDYVANDKKLRYAAADAHFAAATLGKTLVATGRYARPQQIVLTDAAANRASILAVLDRLSGKASAASSYDDDRLAPARPQDAVIVYFAGHGRNRDGHYELLTREFDGTQGTGLLTDEELRARFNDMNARDLMLVIDACESGRTLSSGPQRIGPFSSRGFAQMAYDKGMFVLAASQADAAAYELEALGHGLLTHVLVQLGIVDNQADRDPRDGTTTVRELFQFAVEQVPLVHRDKRVARGASAATKRGVLVPDDGLGYWQVPRSYLPAFGYNSEFILNRTQPQ